MFGEKKPYDHLLFDIMMVMGRFHEKWDEPQQQLLYTNHAGMHDFTFDGTNLFE